jgi:NAD(P)-dependent dehydrogenase (short-subunit alcohol dehydrogenase family)
MSSSPTGQLAGKVVAITGGARGIGAATATRLAQAGARVAIGDLDLDLAQSTAERIGSGALAARLDVTDKASLVTFLDTVESRLGPLDVFVNNAGIMPLSSLLDEDDATTARMIDLNLRAVIVAAREAARRMVARGAGGHIVNVASTAGKAGLVGGSTYCATKAGVIAFSEGIEQELAEHGVHVSTVMPGIVQTELATGVADLPGLKAITPEQVADAIAAALAKPRLEVFVPKAAGPLLLMPRLLPRRAALWVGHRLGADQVFLTALEDPDRKRYEDRAARQDTKAEEAARR